MIRNEIIFYGMKLRKLCKRETCYPKLQDVWNEDNPFLGHCAIVAICLYEKFGGKICRGAVKGSNESHYWNEIDGETYDLTKEQFKNGEEILFLSYKVKKDMLQNKNFKERYTIFKMNLINI